MAQPFAMTSARAGDTLSLALSGELDAVTAPQLATEIGKQMAAGVTQVDIDCTELQFLDSKGMGELLR